MDQCSIAYLVDNPKLDVKNEIQSMPMCNKDLHISRDENRTVQGC